MQFRPVVSAIFKKLHSKTCGYLVIIRHFANTKLVLCVVKPCYFFQHAISSSVLFRPVCYFENNRTLPLYEFYTVYEIAV